MVHKLFTALGYFFIFYLIFMFFSMHIKEDYIDYFIEKENREARKKQEAHYFLKAAVICAVVFAFFTFQQENGQQSAQHDMFYAGVRAAQNGETDMEQAYEDAQEQREEEIQQFLQFLQDQNRR